MGHFFRPPQSLVLIVAGALVALLSTVLDPKAETQKLTLAIFAAAISLIGGIDGYRANVQSKNDAQASAAAVSAKTEEIATLTKEGRDLARANRELSNALMKQSENITHLSSTAINETTGGDSFCYIDMSGDGIYGTNGLIASFHQSGRFPLINVSIVIVDEDALRKDIQNQEWRHVYPIISFLTKATIWSPLGTFSVKADESYRMFNAQMLARNGGFTEMIRVARLPDGGWTRAQIVSASYFDKRPGVVFESIGKGFPVERLSGDTGWQDLVKLKRITVQR